MAISKIHLKSRLMAILLAVMSTGQMAQAQEIYNLETTPASVQLRTNGLYDLAFCPNIGLEIQTDLGIAFQVDYIGSWLSKNSKHRYWQNYAFQAEIRYYLSNATSDMPYLGHHIGVYGQLATYDFEFGGTGYQCNSLDKSWGVGIAYGYRIPLSRHFSMDFTLGLGYFNTRYTQYVPNNDWYKVTRWGKMTWYGPTKLEVSFVWNINNKNE